MGQIMTTPAQEKIKSDIGWYERSYQIRVDRANPRSKSNTIALKLKNVVKILVELDKLM
jgi:hypothetical protein